MDNDKFFRGLHPCWRNLYKAIKAGASPQEVAPLCPPALAQFFQDKGCPGFEAGVRLLEWTCGEEGQLIFAGATYEQICARCDKIAQGYAGTPKHQAAICVMQATQDLAFKMQTEGPLRGDARLLLAARVCVEIVDGSLLAKLDGTKVMETFVAKSDNDLTKAQDALFDWKDQLAALLPEHLRPIAEKLAADSSGQKVKAKAVALPKRPTLETLNTFGRLDVPDFASSESGVSAS